MGNTTAERVSLETEEELRDALLSLRDRGVKPSNIADRAGVSRACLSKFMSGNSRYLRSDTFNRIRSVVRSDVQRLRI